MNNYFWKITLHPGGCLKIGESPTTYDIDTESKQNERVDRKKNPVTDVCDGQFKNWAMNTREGKF